MKRKEYLDLPEVKAFIVWFANDAQHLSHNYLNRETGREFVFKSLPDALTKYYWPFNSFIDCRGEEHKCKTGDLRESALALNLLQKDLRDSLASKSKSYSYSAKALMFWGGTTNFNNDWFEVESNLITVLQTIDFLNQQDDDLKKLKLIRNLRFNAGLTKLYSLAIDDFVIYDSRVAAALAWFVLKFRDYKKSNEIPRALRFACMPARGEQIRNPFPDSDAGFTSVNNSASKHAHWNIRANWILSEAIKLMPSSAYYDHKDVRPMRALEAALFMWGYDLSNSI